MLLSQTVLEFNIEFGVVLNISTVRGGGGGVLDIDRSNFETLVAFMNLVSVVFIFSFK